MGLVGNYYWAQPETTSPPDSLVVEGALAPPCPTLPQLPGTQFLQPLGVGTLLSWVLEPPFPRRGGLAFPVRQGQGAVEVKGGGGGGVSPQIGRAHV